MPPTLEIDNLGLPPLAGLCSYAEAARPGLSVDETVRRLKHLNAVARGLHDIAVAHLARTPEWEVKCGLGLHLWLDAEHCRLVRERVAEMREPPHQLDEVPDEALGRALEEAIRADGTDELLTAVYGVLRPALVDAVRSHLDRLNPLFDHPTARLLRLVLREQEEMLAWGEAALRAMTGEAGASARAEAFRDHLAAYVAAAGGVAGDQDRTVAPLPPARANGAPYAMDATPRRDARFRDPFNCSSGIDETYADHGRATDERVLALVHKRLREMDVPEWMAPILFRPADRPWSYSADLARQLWDETRHAMMGEVALHAAGVPFYAYPVDMASSACLNAEFTPLEAHLILWLIEQDLMPRESGKRFEWEVARLDGDPLTVALQDYDWADEVLHAQIGRRLLALDFPSAAERRTAAQALYPRFEDALRRFAERSTQEPWWPDFLARARRARGSGRAGGGAVERPRRSS